MSQPFRLGFLTHLEGTGEPRQIYQETIELFIAAEQLGFDVAWIAQHHFRIHPGRLPSPFPFLAAAAQHTRRLRLGTSIVVLPLENPLRVAEDAAVVDVLSDGRLELGVGSGVEAGEFQAFGLDLEQRRVLTSQGLKRLQQVLRGEPLNEAGQVLDPPASTLIDRLWQSALSIPGAQYVAQQGVGLMLARTIPGGEVPADQAQLPIAQSFLADWQGGAATPRIAVSRGIYPASDKRTALREIGEELLRFADGMVQRGQYPPGLSVEQICQRQHIAYGHPDEIAASLLADQVLPYATDLILQFNPAVLQLDRSIRMIEQIATQIAPVLGWLRQDVE